MTGNLKLLQLKLKHLQRMRSYLIYSSKQAEPLLALPNWLNLSQEQHETLAAMRVRFSEYQEHLAKAFATIARQEQQPTAPFTHVLQYAEKLGILESTDQWQLIRELRNAINHEYEDNPEALIEFYKQLQIYTPQLLACHERMQSFCQATYKLPELTAL